MRYVINPKWQKKMKEKINRGEPIDYTGSFHKGNQWLIVTLETAGYKYEVKNCGAGVKRIRGQKE